MRASSGFFILLAYFLFAAVPLPAQHFVSGGSSSMSSNAGFAGSAGYGYPSSGWGDSYSSWGYGGVLEHPSERAQFMVGYAHGDEDFRPSVYMDYEEAVALGKKILEEQAAPKPSLGEIVRGLHLRDRQPVENPRAIILLQNNQGKMLVCRGSDANCRALA